MKNSLSSASLIEIAEKLRQYVVHTTHSASSGHTTSSLSCIELMIALYLKELQTDFDNLSSKHNDRVIFSKGHASPLFYSLFVELGRLHPNELSRFRQIDSPLEGHPTKRFKYTEVSTGSLGQGLSVGLGLAYNALYYDKSDARIYVLMGDGELAEGQVWEAISLAAHYNLRNLVGIVDVNRLGQTGETLHGWDLQLYQTQIQSFGWATVVIDGHNFDEILQAYSCARQSHLPTMIIAKTVKGKGISFWENKLGWHAKPLPANKYAAWLGTIDNPIYSVDEYKPASTMLTSNETLVSTKLALGEELVKLGEQEPNLIVLDADVQDATHTNLFAKEFPERFIQCFIAEQNMISIAVGLSIRGKTPFVSTFAAFLTRAFDQLRMASLQGANIIINGSYCGCSIGRDGASNMGLQDIAMFRVLFESIILYPSDSVSMKKILGEAYKAQKGLIYIRSTREQLPILYSDTESFPIGGSKVLVSSANDQVLIIAAGITVHEALKASAVLHNDNIQVRILDCYCIQPIDALGIRRNALECDGTVLVIEDHYVNGGLGDTILNVLALDKNVTVHKRGVASIPPSGIPKEVIASVGIDADAIVKYVKVILGMRNE